MTNEATSRRIEIFAGLAVMIAGIAGFLAVPHMVQGWAFAIPGMTDSSLSPTFFPRLGMALLTLSGMGVALSAGQRNDVIPVLKMQPEDWKRSSMVALYVVAYAAVLPILGFVIASALFVFGLAATAGYRKWRVLATTAVVLPLLIAFVFRWGLKVILPTGMFF